MNLIDITLVIVAFVFLILNKKMSFVYYLSTTTGLLTGYILAILLVPHLLDIADTNLRKGMITVLFLAIMSFCFWMMGRMAGNRIRLRAMTSRFYRYDKIAAIPYKVLAVLFTIIVIAQTALYIPIIALQYMAQGSTLLYATNKLTPDLFIKDAARRISPDQFRNMILDYDPQPLSYRNLADLEEFQSTALDVAPSVVKVSGRNCVGLGTGSGFIAARHFVITNAHVVIGSSTIYIKDHNGAYPATPILIDEDHDLAVIYSEFLEGKPLRLLDRKVEIGTKALVLGYTGGGDLTPSIGKVNDGLRNFVSTNTELNADDAVSIDASVGPGNSGGPVFNENGDVIAVVAGKGSNTSSLAIRSDLAFELLRKAQNKITPTRTTLCEIGFKRF